MPFLSPIPWEAERFYDQRAAAAQNLTLNRYPVGTGPYVVAQHQPNYRVVLERNPNFHLENYPEEGEKGDAEAGLLEAQGKRLPFIDRAIFMLDQEAPPRWSKFLQGYFDLIELDPIDNDLSNQVIEVSREGLSEVSPGMQERGIELHVGQRPFIRYFAFNMRDDVFGGLDEKKRKLRRAISLSLNIEQYVQILHNGRGKIAHGPLPSGIFGHVKGRDGINPLVYRWDEPTQTAQPHPIETARQLMTEAGYPDGIGADKKQLVLHYDVRSGRTAKMKLDWMNRQLERIGVRVELRETDANRWQTKLDDGNFQFINYGWYADYPDPENFLFLLYGPNNRVDTHGENYANYENDEYDRLFEQMATMADSPKRKTIIQEMVKIARIDAPWLFAWEPSSYALNHTWLKNYKTKFIGEESLKYLDIDTEQRDKLTQDWNQPVTWPLWALLALVILGVVPAARTVIRRQTQGLDL
jgi:ABC-type transport system substrate-binding protein